MNSIVNAILLNAPFQFICLKFACVLVECNGVNARRVRSLRVYPFRAQHRDTVVFRRWVTVSRRWGPILPGRSILDRSLVTQRVVNDCSVYNTSAFYVRAHSQAGGQRSVAERIPAGEAPRPLVKP